MLSSSTRAFLFNHSPLKPAFHNPLLTKLMDTRPGSILCHSSSCSRTSSSSSASRKDCRMENGEILVTLEDWQGWGTYSQIPQMVMECVENLKAMEKELNDEMSFGGLGGKIKGNFKVQEDKKHRAAYRALTDSEKKLQFFSARQIACRLLGSKGYLCQKVVLCSQFVFSVRVRFLAPRKNAVWCLYPNKNALTKSVQDVISDRSREGFDVHRPETNRDEPLNFILIDGTWNNSAAMFRRLKERAELVWGEEDLPCISLDTLGASKMHRLRPQPSWDRTCTAAAALGLLSELCLLPEFSSHGLDKQAERLEDSLDALLEALTARRLRMGRSITRTERHKGDIC
ncbi:hypothetical protein IFM89_012054 [Coptis chinensis]|uniref:tRNA-uridine aminocarboxypropyltransferase n=1 Tax=Coptis chinensis TaxID=261450 RepID=A0A835LE59_9MAGN|nr:hypothetical protein IFM89_012054 [Coptis chinensis]